MMDDRDLIELAGIRKAPDPAEVAHARHAAWTRLGAEMNGDAGVPSAATQSRTPWWSSPRWRAVVVIGAAVAAVVVVLSLSAADAPRGDEELRLGPATGPTTTVTDDESPVPSSPPVPVGDAVYALPAQVPAGFTARSWHQTSGGVAGAPNPQKVQVFGQPADDGVSLERWVAVMVMTSGTVGSPPGADTSKQATLLGVDVSVTEQPGQPFINASANVTSPSGQSLAVQVVGRNVSPDVVADFARSVEFAATGDPLLVQAAAPLGMELVYRGDRPAPTGTTSAVTYSNDPRLRGGELTAASWAGMATLTVTAQPSNGASLLGHAWGEADVVGTKLGETPAIQSAVTDFGRTTRTVKFVKQDVLITVIAVGVDEEQVMTFAATVDVVDEPAWKALTTDLPADSQETGPGVAPAYQAAGPTAVLGAGELADGGTYRWELFEATPRPFTTQAICEFLYIDDRQNSGTCGEANLPPAAGANLGNARIPPSGDPLLLVRAGDLIASVEVTFSDNTTVTVPTVRPFDWYPSTYAALSFTSRPVSVVGVAKDGSRTPSMAVR